MANELQVIATWTFGLPTPVPDDVKDLFIDGEVAECAFRTIRDVAVFTNKRLIVRDSQGLSGKKIEIYTLPYKSINMYSSENSGKLLDFNTEIELWTRAGKIKINLAKGADIRAIDKAIAKYIL